MLSSMSDLASQPPPAPHSLNCAGHPDYHLSTQMQEKNYAAVLPPQRNDLWGLGLGSANTGGNLLRWVTQNMP